VEVVGEWVDKCFESMVRKERRADDSEGPQKVRGADIYVLGLADGAHGRTYR
jgi:hypothetical protein